MNLTYVFEHGDPVLVATFLILILMSVASWYIIFWKSWKLKHERAHLRQFRTQHASQPDWPLHGDFRDVAGAARGSVAVLLKAVADIAPHVAACTAEERGARLEMHLAHTLDGIRSWLDKGLTILASVGSSAPFIGLFGTVWGIYGALTRIAVEGNASLDVVAGPMGEALVATAVGLFAAIPAVLAYNTFGRANRLLVQEYRHLAEQLVMYGASSSARRA